MPPEPNPYVGPRPFEAGDADFFFGREREVPDLVALIVSNPVVLLYAASGAGKSSLLNAAVIGRLEREQQFEVLPVARVRGLREEEVAGGRNIFVAAVISHLSGGESSADSLLFYLRDRQHGETADGFPAPRALVIDQLEEIFTAYPERWADRPGFFADLGDALRDDPLLRVVLSIREDFLAQLDPYSRFLPDGMRARYRLERLSAAAALRAAEEPARRAGHPFAGGVCEQLIEDLQKVRLDTELGPKEVVGEYVEPVQLQVACRSIWEALPDSASEITEEHRERFGNVDEVLGAFYDEAIRAAATAARRTSESALRARFAERFITPMGTRGTVFWTREQTGGIPAAAIDELDARHLIRAELRAGARWYELTHDRLIEPIRASNRAFDAKRRSRRRRQSIAVGATLLAGAAAAALSIALTTSSRKQATTVLVTSPHQGAENQRLQRSLADSRGQLATALARSARGALTSVFPVMAQVRSLTYSNGRLIGAGPDGARTWGPGRPHTPALNSGSARAVAYVTRGQRSLAALPDGSLVISELGGATGVVVGHVQAVEGVALSNDGRFAAAVDRGGVLWIFDTQQSRTTGQTHLRNVYRPRAGIAYRSPAFGGSTAEVAVAGSDGYVRLASTEANSVTKIILLPKGLSGGIAISADGKLLAAYGSQSTVALLDAAGNVIGAFPISGTVTAAFSPSGDRLATAQRDRKIRIWRTLSDLVFNGSNFSGSGSSATLVGEVGNVGGSASKTTTLRVSGVRVDSGEIQTHAQASSKVSTQPARVQGRGPETLIQIPPLGAGKHATVRLHLEALGVSIRLDILRRVSFTEQSYTNNTLTITAPGGARATIVRAALTGAERSEEVRYDDSTFHATMQGVLDHVQLPDLPKTSTTIGFATWCYQQANVADPNGKNYRYASGAFLSRRGKQVTTAKLGDLVFYRGKVAPGGSVGPAAAVYVGDGQVVTFVDGRLKRIPIQTLPRPRIIRTYPLQPLHQP
jgi:WD40 repeat protein